MLSRFAPFLSRRISFKALHFTAFRNSANEPWFPSIAAYLGTEKDSRATRKFAAAGYLSDRSVDRRWRTDVLRSDRRDHVTPGKAHVTNVGVERRRSEDLLDVVLHPSPGSLADLVARVLPLGDDALEAELFHQMNDLCGCRTDSL